MRTPVAVLGSLQQELQAEVAAGDGQDPVRPAGGGVRERDRGVPERLALAVADDQPGRGPNPFWWNV